jgi:hypothetical protein
LEDLATRLRLSAVEDRLITPLSRPKELSFTACPPEADESLTIVEVDGWLIASACTEAIRGEEAEAFHKTVTPLSQKPRQKLTVAFLKIGLSKQNLIFLAVMIFSFYEVLEMFTYNRAPRAGGLGR